MGIKMLTRPAQPKTKFLYFMTALFKRVFALGFAMAEKYYIDTSIWRDYYEDRSDGIRPLGEFAFRFFSYCIESESIILYSNLVLEELGTAYSGDEIKKIMGIVSDLLEKVENPSEQQNSDAKRLKRKSRA